jgi:hypothetical protein
VNEYDDKLKNFSTKEKGWRIFLIIGGIQIFLPSSQEESSTGVACAAEIHQAEIVMDEKEKILKFVSTEDEHPVESLTQWEMELKMMEDWLSSLKPGGGCHEIVMPEETCQHELRLEEDRMGPTKELSRVSLSEEVAEEKFSGKTAELEFATEWSINVIRDVRL